MLKKRLSAFVLSAFAAVLTYAVAGALTVQAWADQAPHFTSVSIVPDTVELHTGDSATVYFQAEHDQTSLSLAGACSVNGVDVSSSFQNLTDGLYRVVYNVGAGDTVRASGTVPVSCEIANQSYGTTTVTAFTQANTLSVNPSGSNNGGGNNGPTNGGLSAIAVPSTGTLTDGQALKVQFGDPSGTTDATSSSCLVNGVETKDTFVNVSAGLYEVTYTVGANDADRSAGQIPLDCTLSQAATVHIDTFTDNNTVAIDASANNGGGNNNNDAAPSFASVTVSPLTGSIQSGQHADILFTESHGLTDLTVTGVCKANSVDVANTFQNLGNGQYKVTYNVAAGDAERPAGWLLLDCTLGNFNGNATAHHPWNDGNTLAIDTNGDGSIDNGTSTLGFTTTASPNSGNLHAGSVFTVYFQDPLPSPDLTVGATGCKVNDVDVAGSFTHTGNGLYKVTYTVGANDAERASGQIPVDCSMQNDTGSVHLVAFTDSNTTGIDLDNSGGNGGNNGTSTISVGAVPSTGTRIAGDSVDVYFEASQHENDFVLGGACRVNDVDVASSFVNLTGGLYKVVYTVEANDSERASGHLPISCVLSNDDGSMTLSAFTDSNTLAIDTDNDGTVTEPTGNGVAFMSTVSAHPSSGTLHIGDSLQIDMQAGNEESPFSVGTCTVNGVNVAPSFQSVGNGLYRVTYTVGAGDTSRPNGTIPVNCTLHDNVGQQITASAFTDSNTVSVDTAPGGQNATSTPPLISAVGLVPSQGIVGAGANLDIYFNAANAATDITLDGACTVNGVNVAPSFANLTGGLYKLLYTVGESDAERSAGMLPISCMVKNGAGATSTVAAFTDNNTLAIVLGNGTGTTTGTTTGGINGNVGTSSVGVLSVSSVSTVQGDATADGTYEHGWIWTFNVTVPSNEDSLRFKFGDWTGSASSSIAAANNMRISSEQATSSGSVAITAAGAYSDALIVTGDLDPNAAGNQVQVKVEMKVPTGSASGSYSTTYGIKSTN